MATFVYNRPVKGPDFIGHKEEVTSIKALIEQGKSVVLYEAPKSGKTSVLERCYDCLYTANRSFVKSKLSFLSVRTVEMAACAIGSAVITSYYKDESSARAATARYLGKSGFRFDSVAFRQKKPALSLDGRLDETDLRFIFELPYRMQELSAYAPMAIEIEEFQNIMLCERGDWFCRVFESFLREKAEEAAKSCSWIFCGSMYNAMKGLFEDGGYFRSTIQRVRLKPTSPREIADYIRRGFQTGGKVIESSLIQNVCRSFNCNHWYINHIFEICDSLSRGFITNTIVDESIATLVAIHEPRFHATVNSLTNFQVNLLRAIADGHKRFNSEAIVQEYGLNSIANVNRLKEALCKKEIVTFDENDEPVILDPLFEYWLIQYYFEIKK